jgi:hypothetical protein
LYSEITEQIGVVIKTCAGEVPGLNRKCVTCCLDWANLSASLQRPVFCSCSYSHVKGKKLSLCLTQ